MLILPRGDVVQWALLSERERRGEYEECDEYHFCFPEARLVDEMSAGVPDLSPLWTAASIRKINLQPLYKSLE